MGKFKNYLLATASLVILGGAFTVIGPYADLGHSKPPPSVTDVNIVNTPVPVQVRNVILPVVSRNYIPVESERGKSERQRCNSVERDLGSSCRSLVSRQYFD